MSLQVGRPMRIGPFQILRPLGCGGMAEAYEALRTGAGGFEQRVCIKCVRSDYLGDASLARLFLREARLAATLSHRNVTRVVDFGVDDGRYFLALELVHGLDLRRFLRGDPASLPVHLVALLGLELAEALEHAHRHHVVHRDVTPANVLLSVDGDIKLSDFGISKIDSAVTRSEVRGNAWYMAPERIDNPDCIDPRSDLFSLGVVLYQAVSSHLPYRCATDLAAMFDAKEGRQVPLSVVAPHLDPRMQRAVDALIQADPDRRPATAAEVVDALAPMVRPGSGRRELRELVEERRAAEDVARELFVRECTETLGTTERAPLPSTRVASPRLGRAAADRRAYADQLTYPSRSRYLTEQVFGRPARIDDETR